MLYLDGPIDHDVQQQLVGAGGMRVASRNAYWDQWGITFVDPDGFRLVLSHRGWSWTASAADRLHRRSGAMRPCGPSSWLAASQRAGVC